MHGVATRGLRHVQWMLADALHIRLACCLAVVQISLGDVGSVDDASVTPSGTPRAALELEAVNQPTRADADGAPVDAKPRDGSLEGQPVLPDSGSDGARTRIATFNELPPPEAALEPAQEAELGLKLGRASASLLGVSPGGPAGNGREIAIAVHAFDPAALGAFRDVARVTTNTASAASLDAIFDATTSCALDTIAVEGASHGKLEVEGASRTNATPEAMLEAMPASTRGADSRASALCALGRSLGGALGGEFCQEPAKTFGRVASLLASSTNSVAVPNGQVREHRRARMDSIIMSLAALAHSATTGSAS